MSASSLLLAQTHDPLTTAPALGVVTPSDFRGAARAADGARAPNARTQVTAMPGETPNSRGVEFPEFRKVVALPLFRPTPQLPKFTSFAAMAEWEGVVSKIGPKSFFAVLTRLQPPLEGAEEIGEFPFSEITDEERAAMTVGSVFRWAVGYAKKPTGRKARESAIYFRRRSASKPVSSTESLEVLFGHADEGRPES